MKYNFTNVLGFSLVVGSAAAAFACSSDSSGSSNGGTGGATGDSGGATGGSATGGSGPAFDGGSDPNRNKVTAGNICKRLSEIQCAGEAHCCTNPGRTFADCQTALEQQCTSSTHLDDIAALAITGFDATKAEAAFTKFEDLASKCDPAIAAFALQADGLRGIAAGTVAADGDCNPTDASSLVSIAAALASCSNAKTNACMPTADVTGWKCAALSAAGGPCFSDVNCQDGLYCDNPTLAFDSGATCKSPRKADGADCGLSNECASLSCGTDKKCKPAGVQTAYCLKQ